MYGHMPDSCKAGDAQVVVRGCLCQLRGIAVMLFRKAGLWLISQTVVVHCISLTDALQVSARLSYLSVWPAEIDIVYIIDEC